MESKRESDEAIYTEKKGGNFCSNNLIPRCIARATEIYIRIIIYYNNIPELQIRIVTILLNKQRDPTRFE